MTKEKRITLNLPIEEYEHYQQQADDAELSLQLWIRRHLMKATGYKNVEVQGVTTKRRKYRPPASLGKYARYDVEAARAYVEKMEGEGELSTDDQRKLAVIRKAIEKIQAPGRNVMTGPQRREMKRWRLANYGE